MTKDHFSLIYDTSANACNVGIFKEDQLIAHQLVECQYGHAEHIIGLIQNSLKEANLFFNQLSEIYTTKGPGSFTGIRVGLSVAKMLELTLNIPCIGVDNFSVAAQYHLNHCPIQSDFLIILDTRKEDFFTQAFDQTGTPRSEPQILQIDAIKTLSPDTYILSGDGTSKLNLSEFQIFAHPKFPELESIFKAGQVLKKNHRDMSLSPFYLAPPKVTLKSSIKN